MTLTRSLLAPGRTFAAGVALLLAATLLPLSPAHAELAGPTDGGRAIILSSETREVADGITHSTYERLDELGRNHIDVLKVDLSRTTVKYLDSGQVAGVATLTEMAGAGDVDAAVNGDFFDINNSGAPLGAGVEFGEVVTSPNENHQDAAVITTDGLGMITKLLLDGTATINGEQQLALAGLNMLDIRSNRVAVYDHQWGDYPLLQAIDGDPAHLAVRVGADGKVAAVGEDLSADGVAIAEGEHLLVARGAEAVTRLSVLRVGDTVEIAVGVTDDVDRIAAAIGGNWAMLVVDGEPMVAPDGSYDAFRDSLHPRTAIGFGNEGATMYLVTVDGRQTQSRGMTLPELGRLMVELGATEAMNLDGGGSTTMVVRDAGAIDTDVVNSPSDGAERSDSNGLGVVSNASDGVLSGINLSLAGVARNADRLFPGLHRTVLAKPHDAGGRPVDADVKFLSSDRKVLTVDDSGLVTAVAPGTAEVIAKSQGVESRTTITVLGEIQSLHVTPNVVQLSAQGERQALTVTGVDAQGFVAPVDPTDIEITGGGEDFTLEPATSSTFELVAAAERAGGLATLSAGGASVEMSYLIGRETVLVTDFSEGTRDVYVNGARSSRSIEARPGEGRDGGDAIAFTVDFTQSTATRTANLRPLLNSEARRLIEGSAVELRVWVKGDGVHTPMVYGLVDNQPLDLPYVYNPRIDATDEWQEIVIRIPQGYDGPFFWSAFSFYETAANLQYETTILIDSIELVVAPEATAPEFVQSRDFAVIGSAGSTDDSPTRIAVMSDAQFVGRAPESSLVEGARRTLREMVAAEPDAIYIVGDFTDEANDVDFELARRILDEEVVPSGIPWTYVPGNHEIMGQPIENFERFFGDTATVKDVDSTRVITLDSSPYKLLHDFGQVRMLHDELEKAKTDESVSGVVVMFHHPTRDFLPGGSSGLRDPLEADMIEGWLSSFTADSGKHVALVGAGVGAFHARQLDGVLHITNGNSGKAATSSADWGGFRGWTMLGVDPAQAEAPKVTDWMTVETRAWVDEDSLAISVPVEQVDRRSTVTLDAGFTQDGIAIPVRWPVSAAWGGDGIFVGDAIDAPRGAVAAIDPRSRELTVLDGAEDEITVTLTVNGRTATRTLELLPLTPEQLQPGNRRITPPGQDDNPANRPVVPPGQEPGA